MIELAKKNAESQNISINFRVSDFKFLSKNNNKSYDAILCMGNSLSHILTDNDLLKSLKEMHQVLNKNKILVLHIRNYEKLLNEKKRFFTYKNNHDIFFYVWDFEPKKIVNIINYDLKTDQTNTCSFEYNPILKTHLEDFFKKSGFKNLQFFGNNQFKEFDINQDDDLLVVCQK